MDRLKLKVTEGNAAGTEIEIADELLIGRSTEGEGRLGEDIEISRRHARINRTSEGTYEIEDLGSTNGTIVNGRVIDSPEELIPGDTIGVGATRLVVQVTELAPPVEEEAYPHSEPMGAETEAEGGAPADDIGQDQEPEGFASEPEDLASEPEDLASEPIVSVPGPEAAEEEPSPFFGPEEEEEELLPAQPVQPLPRLSLHLDVDFETGEAEISLDEESDVIRLILDEDGRWRLP